ncbi:MAG: hypothetical protein ABEK59_09320 [Halobacteria archaeon]
MNRQKLDLSKNMSDETQTDDEKGNTDPEWLDDVVDLARKAVTGEDELNEDIWRDAEEMAEREGYSLNYRTDDAVLVVYPEYWTRDGVVDFDAVEDTDAAYEFPLETKGLDFPELRKRNSRILDRYRRETEDSDHVYNAEAFVEYLENHHHTTVKAATEEQVKYFLEDYYVRNVWPPEGAEEKLTESLKELLRIADNPAVTFEYGET